RRRRGFDRSQETERLRQRGVEVRLQGYCVLVRGHRLLQFLQQIFGLTLSLAVYLGHQVERLPLRRFVEGGEHTGGFPQARLDRRGGGVELGLRQVLQGGRRVLADEPGNQGIGRLRCPPSRRQGDLRVRGTHPGQR